jgi:hypothetical protein
MIGAGSEANIHAKRVRTKKVFTLNLPIFKTNYLGLCVLSLIPAFKCPNARICVIGHDECTFQCTDMRTSDVKGQYTTYKSSYPHNLSFQHPCQYYLPISNVSSFYEDLISKFDVHVLFKK